MVLVQQIQQISSNSASEEFQDTNIEEMLEYESYVDERDICNMSTFQLERIAWLYENDIFTSISINLYYKTLEELQDRHN